MSWIDNSPTIPTWNITGNVYPSRQLNRTIIQGFLDVSGGNIILRNGGLYTQSDISSNGNLYVSKSYISGNLAIGKTNAGFPLDVSGTINATALYVGGVPQVSSQWTTTGANIYYSSGNVGIATTEPYGKLHTVLNGSASSGASWDNNFAVFSSAGYGTVIGSFAPAFGIGIANGGNSSASTELASIAPNNFWMPINIKCNGLNILSNSGTSVASFSGTALNLYNRSMTLGDASGNVGVGINPLASNTGTNNSAFGYYALNANTTGSHNSAFGQDALRTNTTGNDITAIGYATLFNNSTGISNNTAIGSYSMYGATLSTPITGGNNTAVGLQTLYYNTSGSNNTAVGIQSLYYNTSGYSNTAVGAQSLQYLTTGSNNVAIGYNAGRSASFTTGNNCTFLGGTTNATGNYSNSTAVGYGATITGSSQIVLGTTGETVYTPGGLNVNVNTSTLMSATTGTVTVYNSYGTSSNLTSSSIVFPSSINYGSDYGFILYVPNSLSYNSGQYNIFSSASTECASLVIGCENDLNTSAGPDSVIISPAGYIVLYPNNGASTGITYITGNVGIGVKAPAYPLDVIGGINVSITGQDVKGLIVTSLTNSNSGFFASAYIGGSSFNSISVAGDAGIFWQKNGTSTPGTMGFIIAPWQSASTGIRISTSGVTSNGVALTSDDRIKTNEEFINDATTTLLKLRPQKYKKHFSFQDASNNSSLDDNYTVESGLIAQEVYYEAPELRYLVTLAPDANPVDFIPDSPDPTIDPDYSSWGSKPASLNYTGLIAYLIQSIKELNERIAILESR